MKIKNQELHMKNAFVKKRFWNTRKNSRLSKCYKNTVSLTFMKPHQVR